MKFNPLLYLVTDSTKYDMQKFLTTLEAACKGGVTLVQLREKERSSRDFLEFAKACKKVTDKFNIPLIINDRVDIALACDAAGVHVGAEDMPVADVRRLLGPDKIVGATTKTVVAAEEAYKEGADYLGVGAIYPTTTKVKTVLTSIETLDEICKTVPIPVVAIGGLNAENISVLENSSISGIAVVSAIMYAQDPKAETTKIKKLVEDIAR